MSEKQNQDAGAPMSVAEMAAAQRVFEHSLAGPFVPAEFAKTRGVVKWFNAAKGYGFIDIGDGIDVFVHYSQIAKDGYRALSEGERVEFVMEQGPKGRQAKSVVAV